MGRKRFRSIASCELEGEGGLEGAPSQHRGEHCEELQKGMENENKTRGRVQDVSRQLRSWIHDVEVGGGSGSRNDKLQEKC
jgi:hypothetical protein